MKMAARLLKVFRRSPEAIPLFGVVCVGVTFMTFMGVRAALKTPDVVWNHKTNPYPWQAVKPNENVKMLDTDYDYSKIKSTRPEY